MRNIALRHFPGIDLVLLRIDRYGDVRHPTIGQRAPACQVRDVLDMIRSHDARVVHGDIHEDFIQLHVLLRIGMNEVVILKAGHGKNGLSVELRIIQAIQQMQTARSRRRETDAELPRVFRVSTSHERGGFLVAYLDESNLVRALSKRFHDSVDAVSGQTKYHIDSPVTNSINQNVRRRRFHCTIPLLIFGLVPRGFVYVNLLKSKEGRNGPLRTKAREVLCFHRPLAAGR